MICPQRPRSELREYVYDVGLDVDDALDVLSIKLRDELIEKD